MSREHHHRCIPSLTMSPWLSSSLGEIRMSNVIRWCGAVLGAMLFAGVLSIVLLRQPFGPIQPLISVSFLGYTNSADGQMLAMFALSNRVSAEVLYISPQTVVLTNGDWSMLSASGRSFRLLPREEDIVTLPKPTDTAAWKLPVFHGPLPSKPRIVALRVCQALPYVPSALSERIEMNASVHMRLVDSEVRTD
jgi:hypothetical protein